MPITYTITVKPNVPAKLDIKSIHAGVSWEISISSTTPIDDGEPGTWRMVVSKGPNGELPVMEIEEGEELIVSQNGILAKRTTDTNIFIPRYYYYGIRKDYDDGGSWLVVIGRIEVQATPARKRPTPAPTTPTEESFPYAFPGSFPSATNDIFPYSLPTNFPING